MSANEHGDNQPGSSEDVIERLRSLLIEATAELIYLRQYGKDGAVWWANESKDVWRGKAIAELSMMAAQGNGDEIR